MKIRRRYLRTSILVVLVVASCSPDSEPASDDSEIEEAQTIEVTRDAGKGPVSCQPAAVGELMVEFLHAVNTDATNPTTFFASSFQWYSMTEGDRDEGGRHFVASDLPKLARYFEERSAHNETMKLLVLSVLYERERDLGHIQYAIERRADDTRAFGTVAHGKGAIACDEGKIELLSMGMDKDMPLDLRSWCPEPRAPVPDSAIVCS